MADSLADLTVSMLSELHLVERILTDAKVNDYTARQGGGPCGAPPDALPEEAPGLHRLPACVRRDLRPDIPRLPHAAGVRRDQEDCMNDVTKHNAFWLVWCPTADRTPRYRHTEQATAVAEAERLAQAYPGRTFIVLASVCARRFGSTECIDLRPEVDDVPF